MSLKLIVEGGGDRKSKSLNRECRRAFAEFLGKAGLAGRLPSIEAAGGREQAYDAFRTAHARDSRTVMLLVDAEAPVTASDTWTHLQTRDGWTRPAGATNDQCHLMVQVMESWSLADRASACRSSTTRAFGRRRCQGIPGRSNRSLRWMSKMALNGLLGPPQRGRYHKGRHSFEILASLDPAKVTAASPYARRFVQTLLALS